MSSSKDIRRPAFAQLLRPDPPRPALRKSAPPRPTPPPPPEPKVELPDVAAITEAARIEGFELGQSQGYAEGVRQAHQEQIETTQALLNLVENALTDASRLVHGIEQDIVELSIAIAEKIVEREVQVDSTLILGVIRAALAEVQETSNVHVRVHPLDFDLARARWEDAIPISLGRRAELVPDELVERGGCIIETRVGHADAQPGTKIAQVAASFRALLHGEQL